MAIRRIRGLPVGSRVAAMLILFVLAVSSAFFAADKIGAQEGEDQPASPHLFRIVYTPLGTGAETLEKFKPFTDRIGRELKVPVEAVCLDDFETVYKIYEAGEFDVAYMPPLPFVEVSPRAKFEVVAMEKYTLDKKGYRSVIITRKEPLRKHKGIVLAFTNTHSTSGYLVPQFYFLTEIQTPPEKFADKVVFAGDHKSVIKGVYDGEYDVGATNNVDLNLMEREKVVPKGVFSTIWTSDLIPGSPVCVNPKLPAETKTAVLAAVLSLNQDKEALEHINIAAYQEAEKKDYEIMFRLKKALGK